MTNKGKKLISHLIVCFVASFVAFSMMPSNSYGQEEYDAGDIVIAPNSIILVISSDTQKIELKAAATDITVHTEIPYADMHDEDDPGEAWLINDTESCGGGIINEGKDEIEKSWYKEEELGDDFVAKFSVEDFLGMELCIGDWNYFRLEGTDIHGQSFFTADYIVLIKYIEDSGVPEDPEDPEEPVDQFRYRESDEDGSGENGKQGEGWPDDGMQSRSIETLASEDSEQPSWETPPGWSQQNPGEGGSDGPGEKKGTSDEVAFDTFEAEAADNTGWPNNSESTPPYGYDQYDGWNGNPHDRGREDMPPPNWHGN